MQGRSALWYHLVKHLEFEEGKNVMTASTVADNSAADNGGTPGECSSHLLLLRSSVITFTATVWSLSGVCRALYLCSPTRHRTWLCYFTPL